MLLYAIVGLSAAVLVALLFPAITRPYFRRRGRRVSHNSLDRFVSQDARAAEHGYTPTHDEPPHHPLKRARPTRAHAAETAVGTKTCPVCRSVLEPGERIKSVVYKGGVKHREITEFTTHIFGCPNCYPANTRNERICPVCHGKVRNDGYLIARMLERKGRKPHVRVLGCTDCRENRRIR